jgi:hypothetical protein
LLFLKYLELAGSLILMFWNIENWKILHFFEIPKTDSSLKNQKKHTTLVQRSSILFIYTGASHEQKTRGFFCFLIFINSFLISLLSFHVDLFFFNFFNFLFFFVLRRDKKVACLVWNRTCLLHRDLRKSFRFFTSISAN